MGNRLRDLRRNLEMSQTQFSRAFGVPLANLRQYELGRHMPPPTVRAYFKVIAAEPDLVQRVIADNSSSWT